MNMMNMRLGRYLGIDLSKSLYQHLSASGILYHTHTHIYIYIYITRPLSAIHPQSVLFPYYTDERVMEVLVSIYELMVENSTVVACTLLLMPLMTS